MHWQGERLNASRKLIVARGGTRKRPSSQVSGESNSNMKSALIGGKNRPSASSLSEATTVPSAPLVYRTFVRRARGQPASSNALCTHTQIHTHTRARRDRTNRLCEPSALPVKHRRAYLQSSRASSINISASLAFNYTIIEGLRTGRLLDPGTRVPIS